MYRGCIRGMVCMVCIVCIGGRVCVMCIVCMEYMNKETCIALTAAHTALSFGTPLAPVPSNGHASACSDFCTAMSKEEM